MAGASGAIASFFMDLVYRINESSEQKFTRSIDASEKSAESLSKTLVDLGKVMQELGSKLGAGLEEPARKFANSSHKVKETAEGLDKGFKSLGVTAIAAGTAWAAGINKVTKEYSQLYIQARLIGGTVTDLKNAGDAAEKAGSSAGKLQGAAASLTSAVRSNIASKGMVERLIGTDFDDTVKKVGVVKGALIPVFHELEAMVKAHGGNRNVAYLTAESFYGLSKSDLDWYLAFGKDWEKQEERIAKVRKEAGLNQDRSAKQANEFWNGMSRIGDAVETIWLQTFDTIFKPLKAVIDLIGDGLELITKINAVVPGAAMIETLAAMGLGAKVFISALSKITGLFGGIGTAAKLAGAEASAALGGAAGGLAGKAYGKAWALGAHAMIIGGVHAALSAASDWVDEKTSELGGPDYDRKKAQNTINEDLRKRNRGIAARVLEAPGDALEAVGLGFGPHRKAIEYMTGHPEMPGAKEYFERNPTHRLAPTEGEEKPAAAQKRTGFHTQGAKPIMEQPAAAQPTGKPVEVIVKNPASVQPRPGETAPGSEVNRNPMYEAGGIVPINAHAGEIVLPAALSRALLGMVHAIQGGGGGGTADDGTTKKSAGSVLDWLGGLLVPRVKIDNTDDLKPEDEALKKATEEAAKAGGAGGGGGAPFSGFYNQQGQSTSGGAPAAGGTYMSGGVPVTTDGGEAAGGGGGGGGHAGHGHAGGGGGGAGAGAAGGGGGADASRKGGDASAAGQFAGQAIDVFKKRGWSDAAIQAVMAHGLGEGGFSEQWKQSGAINKKTGEREQSFGHWQFNMQGGEGPGYMKWAAENKLDPKNTGNQARYVAETMEKLQQRNPKDYGGFTQQQDFGKAFGQFETGFEKSHGGVAGKMAYARSQGTPETARKAIEGYNKGTLNAPAPSGGEGDAIKALDPYTRNTGLGDNARPGGASPITGTHPEFAGRVAKMLEAMPPELRAKFKIYSGFRDQARQGLVHGSVKHSHHTGTGAAGTGMAMDTSTDPAMLDWIHKHGGEFGVGYPLAGPGSGVKGALNIPGEGHHLEPTEGGSRVTDMAGWIKQQDAKRAAAAAAAKAKETQLASTGASGLVAGGALKTGADVGADAEKKGEEAGAAEQSPLVKFYHGLIKAVQTKAGTAHEEATEKSAAAGEKEGAKESPVKAFQDNLAKTQKQQNDERLAQTGRPLFPPGTKFNPRGEAYSGDLGKDLPGQKIGAEIPKAIMEGFAKANAAKPTEQPKTRSVGDDTRRDTQEERMAKGDRFAEVRNALAAKLGHEPSSKELEPEMARLRKERQAPSRVDEMAAKMEATKNGGGDLKAGGALTGGSKHFDRALAPLEVSGLSPGAGGDTINNSGGNRSMNSNMTNHITVNGHSGESPGATANRYSRATADLYRNSGANLS